MATPEWSTTPENKSEISPRVLRDEPLFQQGESFEAGRDAFNHNAYAKALSEIFAHNAPPLSVGLFGTWGIGKSTIINLLFQSIREAGQQQLLPIYFNAWKFSGDSFRRQFLIEVARAVYEGSSESDREIRRLEELNYADVLRQKSARTYKQWFGELMNLRIQIRDATWVRLVLAVLIVLCGGLLSWLLKSKSIAFLTLLGLVLPLLFGTRLDDHLVIEERSLYDPKLMFPEQFEAEFTKLIRADGPIGSRIPLIVIDDIDRCDSTTIRDVLITMKTFLGHHNCHFLVPCDDRALTEVLKQETHQVAYEDELLRKYFNVSLRIAPLHGTDLTDFASAVAREWGIPEAVVQVAILANFRDARKMKHFLNTFVVKYQVAKARRAEGFLPFDIDKNLEGFAKGVLLEDQWPDAFALMIRRPEAYMILHRSALGQASPEETKSLRFDPPSGLYDVLKATRDIDMPHGETFLALKASNPEAQIPNGFELKNAIVTGDQTRIDELLPAITSEHRAKLKELVVDLLHKTSASFRRYTIAFGLRIYSQTEFLSSYERRFLGNELAHSLEDDPTQRLLLLDAEQVLTCVGNAGSLYLTTITQRYEQELGQLDEPPPNIGSTLNALIAKGSRPANLVTIVNQKGAKWANTDSGLRVLLDLHPAVRTSDPIPSSALLGQIAGSLAADPVTSVAMDELRVEVLGKHWRSELAGPLGQRLGAILQQESAQSLDVLRLLFTLTTLQQFPECIPFVTAELPWPTFLATIDRNPDSILQRELHKTSALFAAYGYDAPYRSSALALAANWPDASDDQLRVVLGIIDKLPNESRQELVPPILESQLQHIREEIDVPSERTIQRLALFYDYKTYGDLDAFEGQLRDALETRESSFAIWQAPIKTYVGKMGPRTVSNIVERCFQLITDGAQPPGKKQNLLDIATGTRQYADESTRESIHRRYFELLRHPKASVREAALEALDTIQLGCPHQDFRLALNKIVSDIATLPTSQVAGQQSVLDALLRFPQFIGEDERRSLGALAKRLLQENDADSCLIGLHLVGQLPSMPDDQAEDVIYLIQKLAGETNDQGVQAKTLVQQLRESPPTPKIRELLTKLDEFPSEPA